MKVIKKIIISLLSIIVIFLFLITCFFAYQKLVLKKVPYIFSYTSFINTGTSMLPYIETGDLVIVKKEKSYQKDDIISFITDEGFVNTHRVISINNDYYKTKGDNNKFSDYLEINNEVIYGKVVYVIHGFGYVYNFLLNNYLYIFIGLIVLSIIVIIFHGRKRK